MYQFTFQSSLLLLAVLISTSLRAEVLYIGDSHSASEFGSELALRLQDWSGNLGVDRYAVCGASVMTWSKAQICSMQGKCPYKNGYQWAAQNGQPEHAYLSDRKAEPRGRSGFTELASNPKYQAYVIALGTNDAYNNHCLPLPPADVDGPFAKGSEAGAIDRLLYAIPHENPPRPCVWIGPPAYDRGPMIKSCRSVAKYQRWIESLKAFVEARRGCKFIESRVKPVGSELHFRPAAAKAYADSIANQIMKSSPPPNEGQPADAGSTLQ